MSQDCLCLTLCPLSVERSTVAQASSVADCPDAAESRLLQSSVRRARNADASARNAPTSISLTFGVLLVSIYSQVVAVTNYTCQSTVSRKASGRPPDAGTTARRTARCSSRTAPRRRGRARPAGGPAGACTRAGAYGRCAEEAGDFCVIQGYLEYSVASLHPLLPKSPRALRLS